MDKQRHAYLLREALANNPGARQQIADAVDKSYRAVGYWTARENPTMPSAQDRAIIRRILGNYDADGDAVEVAVRQSALIEWRQDAVLSTYKRHLYEQREPHAGTEDVS